MADALTVLFGPKTTLYADRLFAILRSDPHTKAHRDEVERIFRKCMVSPPLRKITLNRETVSFVERTLGALIAGEIDDLDDVLRAFVARMHRMTKVYLHDKRYLGAIAPHTDRYYAALRATGLAALIWHAHVHGRVQTLQIVSSPLSSANPP